MEKNMANGYFHLMINNLAMFLKINFLKIYFSMADIMELI